MVDTHTSAGPDDYRLAELNTLRRVRDFDPATKLFIDLATKASPHLIARARRRVGDHAKAVVVDFITTCYLRLSDHYGTSSPTPGKAERRKTPAIQTNLVYIGKPPGDEDGTDSPFLSLADWLHECLDRWLKGSRRSKREFTAEEVRASVPSEIEQTLLADEREPEDVPLLRAFLAARTGTERFIVESHHGFHEDLTFGPVNLRERCARAGLGHKARAIVKRAKAMGLDPMREKLQIREIATLLDYTEDHTSWLHRGVLRDLRETAGKPTEPLPPVAPRKGRVQAAAHTRGQALKVYGAGKPKRQPSLRGRIGGPIPRKRST